MTVLLEYPFPSRWDFAKIVLRLAKNNLLFRPRPIQKEHTFLDKLLPMGHFSPCHYFIASYLDSYEARAMLEAYVAWYQLQNVRHSRFISHRDDLFQPTEQLVRAWFERQLPEAGLAGALLFRPRSYNPAVQSERGVYEYVDEETFKNAIIAYSYSKPLITRIDLNDLQPTFGQVEKRIEELIEFKIALQHPNPPPQYHAFGWRVKDDLSGCKSDSSLFSYLYDKFGFNADSAFHRSRYAVRLQEAWNQEEAQEENHKEKAQVCQLYTKKSGVW